MDIRSAQGAVECFIKMVGRNALFLRERERHALVGSS